MERRSFIGLAGATVLVPLAAWAQPAGRVPVIGLLFISNPEPFRSLFMGRLTALGYVDGRNIRIVYRNAQGDNELLHRHAAELVRMKVDVIIANPTPAVHAAKKATSTIPIVMQAGDPLGTGLVSSLARPDGNVTGMSSTTAELGGKLLEAARETIPSLKRMAVLANRNDPFTKPFLKQLEDAGMIAGIEIAAVQVAGIAEFPAAFATFQRLRADAVILQPSLPRSEAAAMATKFRLPSFSPSAPAVDDGALLAYSSKLTDVFPLVAIYVDKILRGAKPADLPIQQPTGYELSVNRKTAQALGLTISESILVRADRIVD